MNQIRITNGRRGTLVLVSAALLLSLGCGLLGGSGSVGTAPAGKQSNQSTDATTAGTRTPAATATVVPAPTSAATEPVASPTPESAAIAGGTIEVIVYHDQNANGAREEAEAGIDTVQLILRPEQCGDRQSTVGQPTGGRYSFIDLSPGPYCVALGPAFNGELWQCADTHKQVSISAQQGALVTFACTEQVR